MVSQILLPQMVRMGAGALAEIGDLMSSISASRPLLVTDGFMVTSGTAGKVVDQLYEAGLDVAVFSDTVPDPTSASLDAGVAAVANHRADAIVAVGGGSRIDTGKAVALLSAQGGHMQDYKTPWYSDGPPLLVVAIPTTSGSGSEATQFSIITDSDSNEKVLCTGPSFLPVAAVLDYELTLSKPPRLTADTAVDALCHAIEAYDSRQSNPFSDSMALAALGTAAPVIRTVYVNGDDRPGREALMLASHQAGIAFSNSSVALIHGMSRPIGGTFHIAHGLSNAMLLPAERSRVTRRSPVPSAPPTTSLPMRSRARGSSTGSGGSAPTSRCPHWRAMESTARPGRISSRLWRSRRSTPARRRTILLFLRSQRSRISTPRSTMLTRTSRQCSHDD